MTIAEPKTGIPASAFEPENHDSKISSIEQAILGTSRSYNDAEDMKRLGKKQLYTRNFRLFATIGFATIFTSTWEFVLVSTYSGLIDGGFGGLFAQYIWTFFGSLMVCLSLAELASMAPTAGELLSLFLIQGSEYTNCVRRTVSLDIGIRSSVYAKVS